MKKLLTIALVLAMATAAVAASGGLLLTPNSRLSTNSGVAKDTLGDIHFRGGNSYVFVQAGQPIEDGEPVVAENHANRVTRPGVTATGARIFGIAQNDIDSGNYAWVQIGGVADVRVDTNSITFGQSVLCATANINSCISASYDTGYMIGVAVSNLATDEDSATLQPVVLNLR